MGNAFFRDLAASLALMFIGIGITIAVVIGGLAWATIHFLT